MSVNATGASEVFDGTAAVDTGGSVLPGLEEGIAASAEDTPASQRNLSRQTLEGIEITTRAFIDVVKFLLREGTRYINARVFTQDPLEQYFSRVRAGQGGSNNPNLGQVLQRNRALHTAGQLGMKRKRGNAGEAEDRVEVTTEPLPKRKRPNRAPKICQVIELLSVPDQAVR